MKKNTLLTFIAILLTFILHSQNEMDIEGNYQGSFTYGNFHDNISFEIKKDKANWQVFFTSLEQNAFKIPARNISVKGDSINFVLQSDKYTYAFANRWNSKSSQLSGLLKVDTLTVPYNLDKLQKNGQDKMQARDITFESNGLQIGGTIWEPRKPVNKAIVFITSSGGADRSGSRAEAMYLAKKGITTFHYDKRGTGVSEGNWQIANMDQLCSDDINAINYFSKKTGIPLSEIGIKGSSQGATKIPYILNALPDLSFGIAVSCPGTALLESDLNYWKNRNRAALGDNLEQAAALQARVFEHIAGKLSRPQLEKAVEMHKSKSWFSSIWIPNLEEVQTDEKLLFNPIPYFTKTKQAVLVIQGTADEIIPPESHMTIKNALDDAQNKDYKIIKLPDANHSMYYTGKSDFPYWAKLHPKYLVTMEKWIDARFK